MFPFDLYMYDVWYACHCTHVIYMAGSTSAHGVCVWRLSHLLMKAESINKSESLLIGLIELLSLLRGSHLWLLRLELQWKTSKLEESVWKSP